VPVIFITMAPLPQEVVAFSASTLDEQRQDDNGDGRAQDGKPYTMEYPRRGRYPSSGSYLNWR